MNFVSLRIPALILERPALTGGVGLAHAGEGGGQNVTLSSVGSPRRLDYNPYAHHWGATMRRTLFHWISALVVLSVAVLTLAPVPPAAAEDPAPACLAAQWRGEYFDTMDLSGSAVVRC